MGRVRARTDKVIEIVCEIFNEQQDPGSETEAECFGSEAEPFLVIWEAFQREEGVRRVVGGKVGKWKIRSLSNWFATGGTKTGGTRTDLFLLTGLLLCHVR
ncbi:ATP-dependent DNA-helicase [Sesbania bispinosa]|nr:ATP-dependent DNA-helicase [Sesbania bispinosa]